MSTLIPLPVSARRARACAWAGALALALAALAAACSDPSTPAAPRCGDGLVDPGEQCDDGNQSDHDDCLPVTCTLAACGDFHVRDQPADAANREHCDQGGVDTANCDADCSFPACGDGHLNHEEGERCDDGNTVSADGCRADCLSDESCGNGMVDSQLPKNPITNPAECLSSTATNTGCAEVCDDGNTAGGDGCSSNCLSEETCRNGILDALGNGSSNPPERCDDGNNVNDDQCRNDCQGGHRCGNGLLDTGEQCDEGAVQSATCDYSADVDDANNCTIPICGDGHLNPAAGEACEDGNTTITDACVDCQVARCGDGAIHLGVEECDDGNQSSTDNCTAQCQVAVCGDGFRDQAAPGLEQCDLGAQNGMPGSGCSATCTLM